VLRILAAFYWPEHLHTHGLFQYFSATQPNILLLILSYSLVMVFFPVQKSLMTFSRLVGFLAHTMTNGETPKVVFFDSFRHHNAKGNSLCHCFGLSSQICFSMCFNDWFSLSTKEFPSGAKLLTIEGYTRKVP